MTATSTFDVFASVDGFASHRGDWGGYWGKQGPELLEHRRAQYAVEHRTVFGARTFAEFAQMLGPGGVSAEVRDTWVDHLRAAPATVLSRSLTGTHGWPDATLVAEDAVEVVARMKEESDVPLRSHGSLRLNRALLAAGLVDRVQLTVFPVVTGRTGTEPVFAGAEDLDLDLLESRVLDGRTLELVYRPALHGRVLDA